MSFSKIKWITFDMGGTLLFPHPSVGEIYAEVLSSHGVDLAPSLLEQAFLKVWREEVVICCPNITPESEKERWRGVIRRTFVDLAPAVNQEQLFDDLWIAFSEPGRWRLPPRTEETLTTLRTRGYRLAVLSNWDDRLRQLVHEMGLGHFFEEIFVSCEVGFEKPDPTLFGLVEDRLQAAGETILHIGDSHHHDVLGAQACGWQAIQVFTEAKPGSECLRLDCLSQLLDLLPGPATGPAALS